MRVFGSRVHEDVGVVAILPFTQQLSEDPRFGRVAVCHLHPKDFRRSGVNGLTFNSSHVWPTIVEQRWVAIDSVSLPLKSAVEVERGQGSESERITFN